MKSEEKVRTLLRYLNKNFPVELPPKKPVVEVLVRTILSQNTNDRNRDVAYRNLTSTFEDWEAIMKAPLRKIECVIRPAGLSKAKAKAIKEVLKKIYRRWRRFDVDEEVCGMGEKEFIDFFGSVKGVGVKTLSVVLVFSCRRPVFPVDTHIYRISRRLGLISDKTTREKAHKILDAIIPDDAKLSLHLQMIEFGRKICKPSPLCEECGVTSICDFYSTTRIYT